VFAFGLVCRSGGTVSRESLGRVGGGAGNLSGTGCLTATHCFAWDVNGDSSDLVSWNGSTWSQPKAVKLTGGPWAAMAETSCPTSTF
jgi:hypothetical protein